MPPAPRKTAAKSAKKKTGRPRRDPDQQLAVPIGMRLKLIREHRKLDQATVRAVIGAPVCVGIGSPPAETSTASIAPPPRKSTGS